MFNRDLALLKRLRTLRLSASRKADIRHELKTFMDAHPVRDAATMRQLTQMRTPISYSFAQHPMPILILLAVLLVGGGTAAAAEGSLPGDALYSVKIGVNEKVRTAFAAGAEAKADVEADLAERRLSESERLFARGRLSEEVRVRLEERFDAHVNRVEHRIAKLEAEGKTEAAVELSSRLDAAIQAHDAIIEELLAHASAQAEPAHVAALFTLSNRLEARAEDSAKLRKRIELKLEHENGANVEAAAQGRLQAAANKVVEVRAFLNRMESSIEAEAKVKAETQLRHADELMVQGKATFEAKQFAEAFLSFGAAHEAARDAQRFIIANRELRIEPNINNRDEANVNAETEIRAEAKVEKKDDDEDEDKDASMIPPIRPILRDLLKE